MSDDSKIVAKFGYPLYSLNFGKCPFVIAGGGGGKGQTGMGNSYTIYEITHNEKDKFDLKKCVEADNDEFCVTNSIFFNISEKRFIFLTNDAQMLVCELIIKYDGTSVDKHFEVEKITSLANSDDPLIYSTAMTSKSSEEDVSFFVSWSNKTICCCKFSTDNLILLWTRPTFQFGLMRSLFCLNDLIFALPVDSVAVNAFSASDGQVEEKALFTAKSGYICRFFSFRYLKRNGLLIYIIYCPANLQNMTKSDSILTIYNGENYQELESHKLGKFPITSVTIDDTGMFMAIGLANGNVHVYDTTSHKVCFSAKNKHNIFVTQVKFLPKTEEYYHWLTYHYKFVLLSSSGDGTVRCHCAKKDKPFGMIKSFGLLWLTLTFLFYLVALV